MDVTTKNPRTTLMAWLPALVVIALTICTAAGISLIPSATAANPTNVTVNGNVSGSIDFTASCGAVSFGANFTSGGAGQVTPDCTMTFATNQVTGGAVTIQDDDGAVPFFCTAACGVGTANTFENSPAGPVAVDPTGGSDDRFGFALKSVAGAGAPAGDVTVDATPNLGDVSWYPVIVAPTALCHATINTVGTDCVVVFGGEPGSPQNSGAYTGTARFTAATT